jgi:hypothetical protein
MNRRQRRRRRRNYIKIAYKDHSNVAQLCVPAIHTWTMWNTKIYKVTLIYVTFQFSMAATMNNTEFSGVTPCNVVAHLDHHHGGSEMSVNYYQTMLCHIPEYRTFQALFTFSLEAQQSHNQISIQFTCNSTYITKRTTSYKHHKLVLVRPQFLKLAQ